MYINSLAFVFFLIVFCIIYFMVPDRFKNIILLFGSYTIYWLNGYRSLIVLFLITLCTYCIAACMIKCGGGGI